MGAIILAGSDPDLYTAANLKLLVTLALQSSAAIESALLYEKNIREVREREEAILRIHEVTMKFVPSAFIRSLGKEVITDVKLGDQIEKEVTVLFTDIRDFTTLSEQMTPGENFLFVSSFNETMGPIIRNHGGFVNQYLGDSIMAIFPDDPRHALDAAVAIQKRLIEFNRDRLEKGQTPIRIGIGMHTGSLIMGITGDEHRLDAATISDTVNTAARIESLTKYFKSPILLSDATLEGIKSRADLHLRFLGKVQLKGKYNLLGIHECFNGLSEPECSRRVQSLPLFDEGLNHYMNREFNEAITAFEQILRSDPADQTTRNLLEHARRNARNGVPDNWTGVLEMSSK
jgi:class 3 adenylate cyclase